MTFQIKCSPAIYDHFQTLGTALAVNCTILKKQTKNKPKKTNQKHTHKSKKTISKTKNKQKTVNNARFETQRDFVLLPNRRSLLIPPALKVYSLLRCLLPNCDQNSQNPTRLPSWSFKQCAYYPWWGKQSAQGAPTARGTILFVFFLLFLKFAREKQKTIPKKSQTKGYDQKKGGYH